MALARLCMKRFHDLRVFSLAYSDAARSAPATQSQFRRFFSTSETVPVEKSQGRDIQVSKEKSKLQPRKRRGLWRNAREVVPFGFNDIFGPSGLGLGNALVQMSENLNKMFENMNLMPSSFFGRMKEDETAYKLRFEVPGLSKEDLKITIEDGYLMIHGEHKEEDGDSSSDDDKWYSGSYGYYSTSLLLPKDAKVDEIKAELKDGILHLTIPKSEVQKNDVKEVPIN